MNTNEEAFRKKLASIRLTEEEKRSMRMHLEARMALGQKPLPSPWLWLLAPRVVAPLLIAALLCGTAGSAYAAQGSVPGDFLYSIKIKVNEPLEVALATTPRAKAQVEAAIATRRVIEAQTLAARDNLTTTTSQELQASFETHATQAVALAEIADAAHLTPQPITPPPIEATAPTPEPEPAPTPSAARATSVPSVTTVSISANITPTSTAKRAASSRTTTTSSNTAATSTLRFSSQLRSELQAQATILKTLQTQTSQTKNATTTQAQKNSSHQRQNTHIETNPD